MAFTPANLDQIRTILGQTTDIWALRAVLRRFGIVVDAVFDNGESFQVRCEPMGRHQRYWTLTIRKADEDPSFPNAEACRAALAVRGNDL